MLRYFNFEPGFKLWWCSPNSPVITGICDPNKYWAQHHHSLKLVSKLKHPNHFKSFLTTLKTIHVIWNHINYIAVLVVFFKLLIELKYENTIGTLTTSSLTKKFFWESKLWKQKLLWKNDLKKYFFKFIVKYEIKDETPVKIKTNILLNKKMNNTHNIPKAKAKNLICLRNTTSWQLFVTKISHSRKGVCL